MTYEQLFKKLTPEQLKQEIVVFVDDEENGRSNVKLEISKKNVYWEYDDFYGTLTDVKKYAKEQDIPLNELLSNLSIVPKGTVFLMLPIY